MAEPLTQAPESACPTSPTTRTLNRVPTTTATPISFFLKPNDSKHERNLTSIATAGLSVSSTSKPLVSPSMSTPSVVDRRLGEDHQDRTASQNNNNNSNHNNNNNNDANDPGQARESVDAGIAGNNTPQAPDGAEDRQGTSVPPPSITTGVPPRTIVFADEPRAESLMQRRGSPASVPDQFGNGDVHAGNPPTLINSSTVASPGPIEEGNPMDDKSQRRDEDNGLEDSGNKAFSYPVPMPALANINDPRRGMSLPHSGLNKVGARSPSAKKHRCPYCATEFTRHHNLKSHLLTHSQEKPYVCQTCQSRFRRLHDLKRHTKLHTGERPHICPKCGRRFARGDALARHNKGPGGCAGRRSSMGSFAGEEEFGDGVAPTSDAGAVTDDAMEGLIYTTEPDRMDEEEERGLNLPSIKKDLSPADHASGRHVSFQQSHQSNTYPPPLAVSRSSQGGLFPPVTSHPGSSSSASPISQSGTHLSFPVSGSSNSSYNPVPAGPSPSLFTQTRMTESPKPLSPNAQASRQLGHGPEGNIRTSQSHGPTHSPNLTAQYQSHSQSHQSAQHASRNSQSSGSGLSVSYTSSQGTLSLPGPQIAGGAPQLPPPPGLNPSEPRFALHSPGASQSSPSIGAGHSNNRPQHHRTHSNSNIDVGGNDASGGPVHAHSDIHNSSIFSQHQKPDQPPRQLSIPSPNPNLPSNDRIWGYMRALEDRVNGLESEVVRLREQLDVTRNSTTQSGQPSSTNSTAIPSTNGA